MSDPCHCYRVLVKGMQIIAVVAIIACIGRHEWSIKMIDGEGPVMHTAQSQAPADSQYTTIQYTLHTEYYMVHSIYTLSPNSVEIGYVSWMINVSY